MTAKVNNPDRAYPSLWAALFNLQEEWEMPRHMVWKKASFRNFGIPKADKGTRYISAPDEWSKARAKVLDAWLWKQWEPRYELGFRPGQGTPVVLDILREWKADNGDILSLDLSTAFARVSAKQVYAAVKDCVGNADIARLAVKLGCQRGRLVMGAPVAPQLFALVMEPMLDELKQEKWVSDIVAYADDIYIQIRRGYLPKKYRKIVRGILFKGYQKLNTTKTSMIRAHQPMHALGVRVESDAEIRTLRVRRLHAARRAANGDGLWRTRKGQTQAKAVYGAMRAHKRVFTVPGADIFGDEERVSIQSQTRRTRSNGYMLDIRR